VYNIATPNAVTTLMIRIILPFSPPTICFDTVATA
jgi:hypothetical protein